jgi:hypothetical protein
MFVVNTTVHISMNYDGKCPRYNLSIEFKLVSLSVKYKLDVLFSCMKHHGIHFFKKRMYKNYYVTHRVEINIFC